MKSLFKNTKRWLSLFLLFFMVSCSSPKPFEFKGIQQLKVEKASLGKNTLNASFQYFNPNHFEVTLKKLDCEVFINDQPFTQYHLDTLFQIPANNNFELPATLEIELSNLLKHSVDILFNKPMKISIKGQATLSKGMFTKQYPILYTTTQKLNLKEAITGSK